MLYFPCLASYLASEGPVSGAPGRETLSYITKLQKQILELEKERRYYRDERSRLRSLVCEDASQATSLHREPLHRSVQISQIFANPASYHSRQPFLSGMQ